MPAKVLERQINIRLPMTPEKQIKIRVPKRRIKKNKKWMRRLHYNRNDN